MKKLSFWKEGITPLEARVIPEEDIDVDVLIIGGGMAGITTLYQLVDEPMDVLLIDKDHIGFGVTANTTGKVTYLQENVYEKIISMYDVEVARQYFNAQKCALEFIRKTVKKEQISCDLEIVDSYLFTNEKKELGKIDTLAKFLDYCHVNYERKEKLPIEFPSISAIKVSDTAVFHPVKYLYDLAHICLKKGMKIMEQVKAMDIDQDGDSYIVHTNHMKIRAKKVILATHYPFIIKPGWIPFKSHIESSYVCMKEEKNTKPFSAITTSTPTRSIRYHHDVKNYLIFAGMTEKKAKCTNPSTLYQKLDHEFETLFHEKAEMTWSTHDVIPNDHLPFIGSISKKHPNLYLATGFQKWGMTNGTMAGMIIADLVKGQKNSYEALFRPYRSYPIKRCIQTLADGVASGEAIIKSTFHKQAGTAKIVTVDGKRMGVYCDDLGKKHYVSIICPHMKCHLLFNSVDKSWDCPCHGSKFDVDGKLLNGPSVFDIKHKR